jgi:hypothetical protein
VAETETETSLHRSDVTLTLHGSRGLAQEDRQKQMMSYLSDTLY